MIRVGCLRRGNEPTHREGPSVDLVGNFGNSGIDDNNIAQQSGGDAAESLADQFNEHIEDAAQEYGEQGESESMQGLGSAYGPVSGFVSDLSVLTTVIDVFATSWPPEFKLFCASLRGFSLDLSALFAFDCVRAPLVSIFDLPS